MAVAAKTQFDDHARVYSNPGSRFKTLYAPRFDDNGVMELVENGRENLYEFIQSHKESTDIHVLLDRYQRGDESVLSRRQGLYGDFTQMPNTYAEALNAMISAENYFNGLPVETRAKFGHSFQQFLASMDKPGFMEAMGFQSDDTTPSVTDVGVPGDNNKVPPGDPVPSTQNNDGGDK